MITLSSSLFMEIKKKERKCISKYFTEKDTIDLSFSVLGYMREKYQMEILHEKKTRVWDIRNKESGDAKIVAKKTGNYYLCIRGDYKKDIKISFNFNDASDLNQAVDVDSIDSLSNAVTSISSTMESIDFNIKKGGANRQSYAEIAHSIRSRITICTTIKIVFLLIFSVFQIMMITSVVQKVKVTKKIELSNTGKAKSTDFL